jgi:hypothetical protein
MIKKTWTMCIYYIFISLYLHHNFLFSICDLWVGMAIFPVGTDPRRDLPRIEWVWWQKFPRGGTGQGPETLARRGWGLIFPADRHRYPKTAKAYRTINPIAQYATSPRSYINKQNLSWNPNTIHFLSSLGLLSSTQPPPPACAATPPQATSWRTPSLRERWAPHYRWEAIGAQPCWFLHPRCQLPSPARHTVNSRLAASLLPCKSFDHSHPATNHYCNRLVKSYFVCLCEHSTA